MKKGIKIVFVTSYLVFVLLFLLLTRQLSLGKGVKSWFRSKFSGKLTSFEKESGFCWTSEIPAFLISDQEGRSRLMLYEDGQAFRFPHSSHDEIRRTGGGRFSHWGNSLYFSTSDNTDPNINGRIYEIREE